MKINRWLKKVSVDLLWLVSMTCATEIGINTQGSHTYTFVHPLCAASTTEKDVLNLNLPPESPRGTSGKHHKCQMASLLDLKKKKKVQTCCSWLTLVTVGLFVTLCGRCVTFACFATRPRVYKLSLQFFYYCSCLKIKHFILTSTHSPKPQEKSSTTHISSHQ